MLQSDNLYLFLKSNIYIYYYSLINSNSILSYHVQTTILSSEKTNKNLAKLIF